MVQVRVSEGLLEGELKENEYGGSFYSFKGIPYAEPPLGDLRFQPPQPKQPWQGVLSAKKLGPSSYQYDVIKKIPPYGKEDCLYLNVYSPNIKPSSPLPVMVWIHGGGLTWGSGDYDFYGPEFLIRQDVILVTLNYRLGALGFLCLNTKEVPGNAGMKDQVAALRWVKRNISSFGGNPDNVTIFGESAGAGSVSFHLLSPMSRGLFTRAIVQSGAANSPWAMSFEPRERAEVLARKLGCYSEDDKELYEFFKSVSKEPLIDSNNAVTFAETNLSLNFFAIVSEEDFGQERFFYGNIYDAMRNGIHEGVEVMTGYVEDEGWIHPAMFLNSSELVIDHINHFKEALVPHILTRHCPIKEQLEIGRKMNKFYFKKKPVQVEDLDKFYQYVSLEMFVHSTMEFLKFSIKANKRNSFYCYKFTCKSKRNFFKKIFKTEVDKEIVDHCDDLAYLFPISYWNQKIEKDSKEFKMIDKVTKLWTNFAKTGNPTPDSSLGAKWEPYCLQHKKFLDIGERLVPGTKPDDEQVQFWEDIFEQYLYRKLRTG